MQRYFPDNVQPGSEMTAYQFNHTPERTLSKVSGSEKGNVTRWGDQTILRLSSSDGGGVAGSSFNIGKFVSLNTDGNTMEVYMYSGGDFEATTTTVYKPMIFQFDFWDGETLVYADGTSVTYDDTSLDKKYQRRANWTDGGNSYSEVQEVTSPYYVGEWLYIITDIYSNKVDINCAGRHWAENKDLL